MRGSFVYIISNPKLLYPGSSLWHVSHNNLAAAVEQGGADVKLKAQVFSRVLRVRGHHPCRRRHRVHGHHQRRHGHLSSFRRRRIPGRHRIHLHSRHHNRPGRQNLQNKLKVNILFHEFLFALRDIDNF